MRRCYDYEQCVRCRSEAEERGRGARRQGPLHLSSVHRPRCPMTRKEERKHGARAPTWSQSRVE